MYGYRLGKFMRGLDLNQFSDTELIAKIAICMLRTKAFLGYTPYSTLQHSICVYKIVKGRLHDINLPKEYKNNILKVALFHDAVEALLVSDLPYSIKDCIDGYREWEDSVSKVIFKRLGIDIDSVENGYLELVKDADYLERENFISTYFFDYDNLLNMIKIFIEKIEKKTNIEMSDDEKSMFRYNILCCCRDYINGAEFEQIGNTGKVFIEFFDIGRLLRSMKKPLCEVDCRLDLSDRTIFKRFLKKCNKLGLNVDIDTALEIYEKNLTLQEFDDHDIGSILDNMPEEFYKNTKDYFMKLDIAYPESADDFCVTSIKEFL